MTEQFPHEETRSIDIPERTADAISLRLEGTEFESVDAYAAFALERLLRELDRERSEGVKESPDENDDNVSRKSVENRLESLGYL